MQNSENSAEENYFLSVLTTVGIRLREERDKQASKGKSESSWMCGEI
jgi:hypothetical protein